MLSFKQQVQKEGSNIVNFSSITTFTTTIGEYKTYYDDNSITPYLPFNEVAITNNSTTIDIWFHKNQNPNAKIRIKANSTKIITDTPIDSFALFTVSGTASVGDITMSSLKTPITENQVLRNEIGNPLVILKKLLPFGLLGLK